MLDELKDTSQAEKMLLSQILGIPLFEYEFSTGRFSLSFRPFFSDKKAVHEIILKAHDAVEAVGLHPDDAREIDAMFARLARRHSPCSRLARLLAEDGSYREVKVTARALFQGGAPKKAIGVILEEDVRPSDAFLQKEERARDSLTDFLSYAEIQDAVTHELETRVEVRRDALVLVEFDSLSEINEKLGRVFGDELLILAAEKITETCEGRDCLFGRFSGDEFLLFFKDMQNDAELHSILLKIVNSLQSLYVGEVGIPAFSVTAGVVMTAGADDLRSLLEKAQKAIYIQKICEIDSFLFYSPEMESDILNQYIDIPQSENVGDIPPSSSETADMLLDILSGTKDLDSAVNLSLLKIGRLYNLAFERVIEFFENGNVIEARKTYSWDRRLGSLAEAEAISISRRDIARLKVGGNKIVTRDSTDSLARIAPFLPERKTYSWDRRLGSLAEAEAISISRRDVARLKADGNKIVTRDSTDSLACLAPFLPERMSANVAAAKIYSEGELSGLLVFARSAPYPKWTKDELSVLRTFSKILSSYLEKARAFKRAEIMVKRFSQTDPLTGLYRYDDFRIAASAAIHAAEKESEFVVCAFDIRGFKYINEFYSYKAGNVFLKAIASFITESDYLEVACRVLSDIFIALLKIPKGTSDEHLGMEIYKALEEFLERQARRYPRCNLRFVCGVCRVSPPDIGVQKAIDNANTLRNDQKAEFKNSCKIYSGQIAADLDFKTHLINTLPSALARHEFIFHLQPKVSLKTGQIAGAEALVRWEKDGKILSPAVFVPVFESNGLITMIDFYVYENVCKYLAERVKAKKPVVTVSMNVSGVHLQSSEFVKNLLALISQYSIPPHLLEFELTETVLLENLSAASAVFSVLQREGFKISIDDFGSGHSSLLLLKEFPFNVVKMDKGFLPKGEEISGKDKIVLASAIDMAAKLNIEVLCEGVENKEHLEFLKTTACDLIQGYYFSKPLPVKEFNKLIEENHVFEV